MKKKNNKKVMNEFYYYEVNVGFLQCAIFYY